MDKLSKSSLKTTLAGSGTVFTTLLTAAVFFSSEPALSQSTVIIGGSGKSNVVVNLNVLEPGGGTSSMTPSGRILRMPGEKMPAKIKLRMPGSMASAGNSVQTPQFKLKPPAMPVQPKPKPKPVAMPSATIAPVTTTPITPPPPAAPTQITKPAPVAPVAPAPPVQVATTPPPPPPVVAAPEPAKQPMPQPAPAPQAAPPPPPAVVEPAAPVAAPVKKQIAALPSATAPATPLPSKSGLVSRISFTGASTRLSNDAKGRLQTLASQITASGDRLQLKAFAGGTSDSSSSSRRLSLSRALAVRSYLIEAGVRSTRIDVRALGRAADSGPPDRVDMILLVR